MGWTGFFSPQHSGHDSVDIHCGSFFFGGGVAIFHLDEVTSGHCGVGWQSLLDVSEDEDAVVVGKRCVTLMTLQAPQAECNLTLVGRQEELEAEMLPVFCVSASIILHLIIPCRVCVCVCAEFLILPPNLPAAGGLANGLREETV